MSTAGEVTSHSSRQLRTSAILTGMRIWMLVDIEPGYERLHIGDRINGTTTWCSPDTLPPALVSAEVPVRVERFPKTRVVDQPDWIATLTDGVATLLPDWPGPEGLASISGCLMYDRYLHLFHHTVPTAGGRIVRRGLVVRRAHRRPVGEHDWYTVHPYGAPHYTEQRSGLWPEWTVDWDCVELDTDG